MTKSTKTKVEKGIMDYKAHDDSTNRIKCLNDTITEISVEKAKVESKLEPITTQLYILQRDHNQLKEDNYVKIP